VHPVEQVATEAQAEEGRHTLAARDHLESARSTNVTERLH
jgi:hypothetical protein